jgi:hypothetical protein
MKKGLLSLLAVALTVVGCQDYDDQFDSLNKEILALKTDLTTIKGLTASVATISSEIKALEGKMVTDADITGILTQVAAVKTAIAEIPAPADNSTEIGGITTQVTDLKDNIATIMAQLTKIQAASGGTYTGNLNITNAVQLVAAQDIVDISADGPLMTITGNVNIDTDNVGTKETASLVTINAILSKLKVISGNVTITGVDAALDAPELLYVTGNLDIEGTSTMGLGKLNTVDGRVELDLYGDLTYPLLGSAGGGVVLSSTATISTVDLSGLTIGGVTTAAGVLVFPLATSVKVGSLPASVTLAAATTVEAHGVANLGAMSMSAPLATAVTIKAAKLTGTVTVSANLAAIEFEATEATGITMIHGASVDISKVTKNTAALTVSTTATGLTATELKTSTAPITLLNVTTAVFPALESMTTTFTGASVTAFHAEKLVTSTNGAIDVKTTAAGGGEIKVKSIAAIAQIVDRATISKITVGTQANNLVFDTFVKLQDLNYTSSVLAGTLTISTTMVSMTTLTLGSGSLLTTLTVSATNMVTLGTDGVILNTVIHNNTALETLNFGHKHQLLQNGTTVSVFNNDKVASLDMSSLGMVKTVSITGNASLTTFVAPSSEDKIQDNVTINITMSGNSITGTFSPTIARTETTPAIPYTASSAAISSWKAFIGVMSPTHTINYSLDVDAVDNDLDGNFDDGALSAQAGMSVINTTAELDKF